MSTTTTATTAPPSTPTTPGSATRSRRATRWLLTALAWAVGILFVLPVLWMVLTSFHSEADAATNPPSFFAPLTLEGYQNFFEHRTRGRRCSTR